MIAIGAVAGLLAVPAGWGVIVIALSIPCLPVFAAHWLVHRGRTRLAAWAFWLPAISVNLVYILACVQPRYSIWIPLSLGWPIIVLPTIGALGMAWAVVSYNDNSVPKRHRAAIGLSVFFLAVLPALTLWTFWPLEMAFLAARPALDRLADQVAAGNTVGLPQRAGLFHVVDSVVDPISGNVALLIDPNPRNPNRFVRLWSGSGANPIGPIFGSSLNVSLGGGWCYHDEVCE
jgi:hypothetical protein